MQAMGQRLTKTAGSAEPKHCSPALLRGSEKGTKMGRGRRNVSSSGGRRVTRLSILR